MNIYFLRHGETEQNERKTYYGDIDCGLNERGIVQSRNAGEYLKNVSFEKVFASERYRSLQTTEIVLGGRPFELIKDSRINEKSFGCFEGLTYEEIGSLYPDEQKKWNEDWKDFCPTGGESCNTFYQRVRSFMEHLKNLNCGNILVVTHGGVVRMAYSYILNENLDMYWKFASRNGDVSVIKYEYGYFYIDSITHMD